MPRRLWSVGTVTSYGTSQYLLKPQSAAAEPWLRTACSPQANTAANARATGLIGTWPTA